LIELFDFVLEMSAAVNVCMYYQQRVIKLAIFTRDSRLDPFI
jgi:hypothetical protein